MTLRTGELRQNFGLYKTNVRENEEDNIWTKTIEMKTKTNQSETMQSRIATAFFLFSNSPLRILKVGRDINSISETTIPGPSFLLTLFGMIFCVCILPYGSKFSLTWTSDHC